MRLWIRYQDAPDAKPVLVPDNAEFCVHDLKVLALSTRRDLDAQDPSFLVVWEDNRRVRPGERVRELQGGWDDRSALIIGWSRRDSMDAPVKSEGKDADSTLKTGRSRVTTEIGEGLDSGSKKRRKVDMKAKETSMARQSQVIDLDAFDSANAVDGKLTTSASVASPKYLAPASNLHITSASPASRSRSTPKTPTSARDLFEVVCINYTVCKSSTLLPTSDAGRQRYVCVNPICKRVQAPTSRGLLCKICGTMCNQSGGMSSKNSYVIHAWDLHRSFMPPDPSTGYLDKADNDAKLRSLSPASMLLDANSKDRPKRRPSANPHICNPSIGQPCWFCSRVNGRELDNDRRLNKRDSPLS
ncbi:uncharacterized protein SPPG_08428 [Spizellomyces punctatus DAOM BR117]|uniref:Uncharacterized protein n=1 Tax=Spizellomyces punctatus (strain DAOM BR117) TaxID=645134 RepID=A0A0L0H5T2_SPIPD|nr:uncharacterized protein SPPG_08428 [Spizellomyces punctatus DAOM BR117]KNC96276.1 hypothetical protein SPPG_08428 [Spizellomyces punctatus DAOM BR117]|eukprot:XP_016604316.1 hypothetical protein SPPG_08428 [Spizellomyces punctatus DAOM BR117]